MTTGATCIPARWIGGGMKRNTGRERSLSMMRYERRI